MAHTKRLLLLRHAKSSWDDPELDDHDRPLAPRGRKAAKLMGGHLPRVSLVLCSSARRARETLELAAPAADVWIERELYGVPASQLIERLRRVPDEVESVLLIGHNPAIQELAVELSADGSELAGRKFPTCALATLSFSGPWQGLGPGRAELLEFVTPRELG